MKEEVGTYMVMLFVFPSNCCVWWGPTSQEVARLLMRGNELISLFVLFVKTDFAFVMKLSFSWSMNLFTFLLFFFHKERRVSERQGECLPPDQGQSTTIYNECLPSIAATWPVDSFKLEAWREQETTKKRKVRVLVRDQFFVNKQNCLIYSAVILSS